MPVAVKGSSQNLRLRVVMEDGDVWEIGEEEAVNGGDDYEEWEHHPTIVKGIGDAGWYAEKWDREAPKCFERVAREAVARVQGAEFFAVWPEDGDGEEGWENLIFRVAWESRHGVSFPALVSQTVNDGNFEDDEDGQVIQLLGAKGVGTIRAVRTRGGGG
jgi:hypothetical protein